MSEKIAPITLKMFDPRESYSFETSRQLVEFMEQFSGKGCLRLYNKMRRGDKISLVEAEKINTNGLEAIGRVYELPSNINRQQFYLDQQRQARSVMGKVAITFPEAAGDFELKDEVVYCSDRPSDLFQLLSMPEDKIDPVLAYELQRHVLFAHISGLSNARHLKMRSRSFLADMQQLLNDHLFEGVKGAGGKYIIESVHDDNTNEVIGFRQDMESIPPTAHLKRIRETVRKIPDIGFVHTSPRKKDDGNIVIKTLIKAMGNGGVIDIDSVQDSIGMMYCLMDPHASIDKLAERVLCVLESGPKKIVSINRRDQVRSDRGQSPRLSFSRYELQFEDTLTSFELIFRTAEQHVNSRLGVGKSDDKGYYDGESHELYDAKKIATILLKIVPKLVYDRDPENPLNLDRIIENSMRNKAEDLRMRYRVVLT